MLKIQLQKLKKRDAFYWVLLIVLTFIPITFLAIIKNPSTIVSIDIKQITGDFLKQVGEKNLPESQMQQLSKQFGDSLNTALNSYATHHHALVMIRGAIVAGSNKDITSEIERLIHDEMTKMTHMTRNNGK